MEKTSPNPTDHISTLEAYQRENAIRFQYIESRLDEGSQKFKRLEHLIWGVYPFILTSIALSVFFK